MAAGVVAMYTLVAVEVSSLAMKRLPRRLWRSIHLAAFASFWLATVHGIAAGTDRTNRLLFAAYVAGAASVVFLTAFRILADRRSASSRRSTPSRNTAPHSTAVTGRQS